MHTPNQTLELAAAANRFLARTQFGNLIDGKSVPAASGKLIASLNPSTGEVIGHLAASEEEDVDRAVVSARAAFEGPWSRWTAYERQALLFRIHDVLERNFEEIAQLESIDMGAPIARTRANKGTMLKMALFYASQAGVFGGQTLQNGVPGEVMTMILRAPAGVVGGIIPWNGPMLSQWWIIGPTLATGCTAVIKPSEEASLSILRTAELMLEAGLPPGVINIVTGLGASAGSALARHMDVDRLAFTGSTATGRRIVEASTTNFKKVQLELGGKSPDIVFADADLDKAVPGASMGVFANSGQICFAGTRVFVERSIANEFCERAAAFTRTINVGNSLDASAQLGPLISARQLAQVQNYIDIGAKEGAKLIAGGARMQGINADGFFIEPAIFSNVSNDMRIAREEIFGPVMSVIPFDTEEEAIRLANHTEYGLGGAVWTRNFSTALRVVRKVQAGVMWVNCYGLLDPMVGFGGIKQSGYGAKGGPAHIDHYLSSKVVYINI